MRSGRINLLLLALDGLAAVFALWIASSWGWMSTVQALTATGWAARCWTLAFLLLWIVISDRLQLSLFYPFRSELMARLCVGGAIGAVAAFAVTVALGEPLANFHAPVFASCFFLAVVVIRLARRAVYVGRHLQRARRKRVVIVGNGALARELAEALEQDAAQRYEVAGFLTPETEQLAGISEDYATESTLPGTGVAGYLSEKTIDQVYIALPNSGDPDVLRLVSQCREQGIAVSIMPHGYELFVTRSVLRNVGGIPLVAVDERRRQAKVPWMRTTTDAVIAAALLLLTSPLSLLVAVMLAKTRHTILRREERCGGDGKPFVMYRFDIERRIEAANWFEKWLAIAKLSELPQLWNVVRGEMSLVGPRAAPVQAEPRDGQWQKQRQGLRPGVTGYAQIYELKGKRNSSEVAHYDLRYCFGWAPLLEMTLMVQTVWSILRRIALVLVSPEQALGETRALSSYLEVAGVNGSQPGAD